MNLRLTPRRSLTFMFRLYTASETRCRPCRLVTVEFYRRVGVAVSSRDDCCGFTTEVEVGGQRILRGRRGLAPSGSEAAVLWVSFVVSSVLSCRSSTALPHEIAPTAVNESIESITAIEIILFLIPFIRYIPLTILIISTRLRRTGKFHKILYHEEVIIVNRQY